MKKQALCIILSFLLAFAAFGCSRNSQDTPDTVSDPGTEALENTDSGSEDTADTAGTGTDDGQDTGSDDGSDTDDGGKTEPSVNDMSYQDKLFDQSYVHTIDITISEADWEDLTSHPTEKTKYKVDVTIDGETIFGVSFATKGNTSLSSVASDPESDRYSFKINFGKFTDDQTYHGLNKLNLNNLYADATYMKDYLSYEIFRETGVDAPLTSYVWLTVNGEDHGLYLAVEDLAKSYLERTQDGEGVLYKPETEMLDNIAQGPGGGDDQPGQGGEGEGMPGGFDGGESSSGGGDQNFGGNGGQDQTPPDQQGNPPQGGGDQQGTPGGFDGGESSSGGGDQNFGGNGGQDQTPPEQQDNTPEDGGDQQGMPGGFTGDESSSGGNGGQDQTPPEQQGNPPENGGDQQGTPGGFDGGESSSGGNGVDMTPPSGDFSGDFEMPQGMGMGMFSFGGSNGADLVYTDDDPESYSDIFNNNTTKATEEDQQRVIEALKGLSEGKIEEYIDIDEVVRYFAAHNFVLNYDSYTGTMLHNYYLYEKDGKLSMLPWDYNLGFGGFSGGSNATSLINTGVDTPLSGSTESSRPMWAWITTDESYLKAYHDALRILCDAVESEEFKAKLEAVYEMILPYIEKDSSGFFTAEEFEKAYAELCEFVSLRAESVRRQIDGELSTETSKQTKEQQVDASGLNISAMGSQGGGNDRDNGGFDMPFGR